MVNCDLYGIKGDSVGGVRKNIEGALGVEFMLHESDYLGGDYYRHGTLGEEHFILQRNFDDVDKEWTEEEFEEYDILFYVNETTRAQEIQKLLINSVPRIALLRRGSC